MTWRYHHSANSNGFINKFDYKRRDSDFRSLYCALPRKTKYNTSATIMHTNPAWPQLACAVVFVIKPLSPELAGSCALLPP